jgi:hypothetical protein
LIRTPKLLTRDTKQEEPTEFKCFSFFQNLQNGLWVSSHIINSREDEGRGTPYLSATLTWKRDIILFQRRLRVNGWRLHCVELARHESFTAFIPFILLFQ